MWYVILPLNNAMQWIYGSWYLNVTAYMFYIFFRLMLHISFNMSKKNELDHFAAMCLGITILDCRLLWRLVVVTLEGSMNYIIPPFIALSFYKKSPKHNGMCVCVWVRVHICRASMLKQYFWTTCSPGSVGRFGLHANWPVSEICGGWKWGQKKDSFRWNKSITAAVERSAVNLYQTGGDHPVLQISVVLSRHALMALIYGLQDSLKRSIP